MTSRVALLLCSLLVTHQAWCDEPVFQLKISNHLFYPDTLTVPAGVRFKVIIDNQDSTAEEFESFELNREKVVMGGATTSVFIGPLRPGTYSFFGEFNPETAQGKIIAIPVDKP
jgi:hypothetical protein